MTAPTVVILAAGKGSRMRSALPKVLHPLCGRPLVHWPIHAAREAGAGRIVVVDSAAAPRSTATFPRTSSLAVQERRTGPPTRSRRRCPARSAGVTRSSSCRSASPHRDGNATGDDRRCRRAPPAAAGRRGRDGFAAVGTWFPFRYFARQLERAGVGRRVEDRDLAAERERRHELDAVAAPEPPGSYQLAGRLLGSRPMCW